jgi:hypothetical protein
MPARLTMTIRTLVTVAMLVAAACGGKTLAPTTTCGTYADAYCAKHQSCTNGVSITRDWGDMSTCVARVTLTCTDSLGATGTGQTAALVEQCTAGLPSYSCADFLDNNLPATCNPTGPGAAGSACTFNAQCASGFCANDRYGTCGTCAAPPAPGDSCATSNCGHGQGCYWNDGVTNLCEPYLPAGSACGAYGNPACAADLTCQGASSTTGRGGTCAPAVATLGGACGSVDVPVGCDSTMGLWCTDHACVSVTFAGDGMPCGYIGSGVTECRGGACYSSAGPYFSYAGPRTGTCRAYASDGAACDTSVGPGCLSPARCVTSGATAGVCTVPVAAVSAACR